MPQCFAVGILDSVAKHRSTQRRERTPDSDAVQQLGDGSATFEVARVPGQAHSLYGPPAVVSRRQGGHVSSPLPGIGVNFLPQRRHRRFRTRRSRVSKNRPRLVPAISPPHAPDYRARARPGRARRPPIGIAVRRHSWVTATASRACCAAHLDSGTSRTSPRALPRQPRKRTHRSGGIVMTGAGQTPHAGTIANVDAEGIRNTRRRQRD